MIQSLHRQSSIFFIFLFIFVALSWANESDEPTIVDSLKRPELVALRLTNSIILDGKLDEPEWHRAGITNFIQKDPNQGQASSEKTEVWVAYDDAALYVAARLYDKPDSIVSRIGRRDAMMNADWFYFAIDSYNDKRTGFYFGVYPSGSIVDGTLSNDSWDDDSWDGVWDAATNVDEKGWTVEMKIPYSQLRFPKQDEYVWGVNFGRMIERKQEESYFVMVPKGESGWVSRFASLNGIKNINPPTRVEILPYAVSSMKLTNQFSDGDPFNKGTMFKSNFGADMKLGLGSNLTLNATLNPDFGQVEVDPAVVNLTQFETFFQEKRPFFIEGSSFFDFGYGGANNNMGFNWGGPDFFYSRRIGRSPSGSEQHSGYVERPSNTTILGAGKISGKLSDNFAIGGLVALTEREYSKIDDGAGNRFDDVVEPLASYSVVRGLNEFNQGKQAIGFLATGTRRDLNESYLENSFNKGAYAFGVDGWTNLDSTQTWVVTGWGAATRVEGSRERILALQEAPAHYFQRPDADHLDIDSNATNMTGYASRIAVNKQQGNIRFNSAIGIISPGFETNDLGFLFRTDQINWHLSTGYNWYEPDGFFRRKGFQIATYRNFDFDGNRFGEGYFLFFNVAFMNYWSMNGNVYYNIGNLDNRLTRGGPWMMTMNRVGGWFGVGSDSREKVVGYLNFDGGRSESGAFDYSFSPEIEIKASSNMSVTLSPSYMRSVTMAQYIQTVADGWADKTFGNRYVFSQIDQHELSGNIRLDWTFTPKLSLQLFLQPLVSAVSYSNFKELKEPRTFSFNEYGVDNSSTIADSTTYYRVDPDGNGAAATFDIGKPDFNFKSLRGNAVLRWEYLPGSTLYFVWTRSGSRYENRGNFEVGKDFGDLVSNPDHEDVFLIKLAYWITP
ncbi:MAG: carbohydrate binding family 9 domain-containing protein [Ignavibacteriae bacterium]|nr:carbohydrate binding family 9 domain-containing protein [Ignavibacteriota bacterium]